jgi:hypothetical protein
MNAPALTAQPIGLVLPGSFPDGVFEAVKDRIFSKVPGASPFWEQLAGSHNGVRYRLRACADYSDEFTQSIQSFGDSPPPERRYLQERQLFGFFVSGYAALDSFSFFMHFAGAWLLPYPTARPYPEHQLQKHCSEIRRGVLRRRHRRFTERFDGRPYVQRMVRVS